MNHKYNIGDIIHDNRFDEYHLIVSIEPDDLFGVSSYLLKRIYGNKMNRQAYYQVSAVDRSNEITFVA